MKELPRQVEVFGFCLFGFFFVCLFVLFCFLFFYLFILFCFVAAAAVVVVLL